VKKLSLFFFVLLLVTAETRAGESTEVNVGVNAIVVSKGAPTDPGTGRQFVSPVLTNSQVIPYLGPWLSGSRIIENLGILPEVMTFEEATRMYVGGVGSPRIHRMIDLSYQFETCKLTPQLPVKELLGPDRKPILGSDGKPLMTYDTSKFRVIGYIYLGGDKKADTVDIDAMARLTAMEMGANCIYPIKKVADVSTSSSSAGASLSGVISALSGLNLTNGQSGAGGINGVIASSSPVYKDTIFVLAYQDEDGMAGLGKTKFTSRNEDNRQR
jgi:hypothetical protein